MKTLLLGFTFACLSGVLIWNISKAPKTATAPYPPTQTARSAPAIAIGEPVECRQDELALVRGRVFQVVPEGLLVSIDAPAGQNWNVRLPVNAGAADSQRLASLVMHQEEKDYGPVLAFEGGVLRAASWTPENAASGLVLLTAHPEVARFVDGERIKVAAAPLSAPFSYQKEGGSTATVRAYTMNYSLGGGRAASFMRERQDNPLDRRAYNR